MVTQKASLAQASSLALQALKATDPVIAQAISNELHAQRTSLKLIASENYSSLAVQLAMGNWLTDKYAEGFPHHRFYGGCEHVDLIEEVACERACELFGAKHAYVQPHSGADANLVAFWTILLARVQDPELERLQKRSAMDLTVEEHEAIRQKIASQKLMGMDLGSGGHLTHGYRMNISSKMMRTCSYGVDPESGLLDYDALAKQVREEKPDILLAGYSAYPRALDFSRFREMADEVGATLMVDMAHFAGLVAGKVLTGVYNPIPYADIVTSTTHKTLRGPRGGIILSNGPLGEQVNKGCPLVLGGPLPHVMAAKAIAFGEALTSDYCHYAQRVVENAQELANSLATYGYKVQTGGTDNHIVLFDVSGQGLTGRQAERLLESAQLTVNRNALPNDPNGAWYTSGIRLGTPALTTRGMGKGEMKEIASLIHKLLSHAKPSISTKTGNPSRALAEAPEEVVQLIRKRVNELLHSFPLYEGLA